MFPNASPTATAIDLGERTVERDREIAKFWLQLVRLQSNQGFNRTEIRPLAKVLSRSLYSNIFEDYQLLINN